jgi:hypothetical protein
MLLATLFHGVAIADNVSGSQRRAAADYLSAVAAGSGQAVAFAIHPDELVRLRDSILQSLREESARSESTQRQRLFGEAMSLSQIERLTPVDFFAELWSKVSLTTRLYEEVDGLNATRDGRFTHVLVKGRQPREFGQTRVTEVVTLLPYGREWKAALPPEFEARIEDLLAARSLAQDKVVVGSMSASTRVVDQMSLEDTPEAITTMLEQAERTLVEGDCRGYYRDFLSPDLQRSLAGPSLQALIRSCERGLASRELLIAALRIVRRSAPQIDASGRQAVYDVSGKGLPYDRFVLLKENGQWFIAE